MGKRKKNAQLQSSLPTRAKIRFSFEYYDKNPSNYCLSCWESEQIRRALLRLREICTKSFDDLSRERRIYHFGEVIWEKTTKKSGFPDGGIKHLPPFHFALLGINNQKARVYGAFSAGVFYIVWFDFNHEIWPSFLKHT